MSLKTRFLRFLFKTFFNICAFIGLGYGGIFFSNELRKLEEQMNEDLKKL